LKRVDVVVIGAGAAGLFCAAQAGQRGARVLLVDHADKVAEKIRISGGGRCNFTNRDVTPANFHSRNPHFCRSALARYTSADFIALVQRNRIAFHEKHRGQLFCDESSQEIIDLLLRECDAGHVERWQPCAVAGVRALANPSAVAGVHTPGAADAASARFEVDTDRGPVQARSIVVATGGLPVPKIGATDFGLRLARQFGHGLVEPRPALVPLVFDAADWAPFMALAGVSLEVEISAGSGKRRARFIEDLLFTHRGLSGPAVLQASSYWQPGESLEIAFAPGTDWPATLSHAKATSRRQLGNELATHLPQRLAQAWLARGGLPEDRPMPEVADKPLRQLAESLAGWRIAPNGTEGWKKAEVMSGGVDTREIDSRTLESKRAPGLHFIGEVMDVTGWLGGYNFQWAWSSAHACAEALAADLGHAPAPAAERA
jgi:predicted Rossmann fold flavoprotein